jgi:hypothetical protein
MSFNLADWYSKSRTGEIVIEYKGEITSDLITNLLEVAESKLDELETPSKIRKKLYNVLVESLQNLFHHSEESPFEEDNKAKVGAIILTKNSDLFTLMTGNYTCLENKKKIIDRIEQINSLSKDELKQLYKMILNNEEFSEKGGGGLGMIDIARKTGNRLSYSFQNITDKKIFYQINTNIN